MTTIQFKGNPIHTSGELPSLSTKAPAFTLTKTDLSEISYSDLAGQWVILNIFPSLDTPVCAASVRKFNSEANQIPQAKILCISMDLPFAQKRFCAAEGLENVIPVSAFRHPEFAKDYGVKIIDGPLAGLLARSVMILDPQGQVIYTQQVPEITEEPDYETALSIIKANIK